MSIPSASAEPETAADQRAADAQYYRHVLHELIDMGADLARLVHQRAKAEAAVPADAPAPDATIAFDRIARSVRRTIALARTLDEPALAPEAGHPAELRTAARKRVIRLVENAIHREARGEQAEALHAELLERMDGPDVDGDIGHRTVSQIVDTICADLGLEGPDGLRRWKRRTPEDIALLCARATKMGATKMGATKMGAAKMGSAAIPPSPVRTMPLPVLIGDDPAHPHPATRFRGSG